MEQFLLREVGKMRPTLEQNETNLMGQNSRASVLTYIRAIVCEVVRAAPEDTIKGKLAATAKNLHLSPRRVLRYWQNAVQVIEAHEYRNIIELAQENRRQRLRDRHASLERLRAKLAATDVHLAALAPPALGDRELPASSPTTGAVHADVDNGIGLRPGLSG
jgi:hypothetical protein